MNKQSIREDDQRLEILVDRVAEKLDQRQVALSRQVSSAHAAAAEGFAEIATRTRKPQ